MKKTRRHDGKEENITPPWKEAVAAISEDEESCQSVVVVSLSFLSRESSCTDWGLIFFDCRQAMWVAPQDLVVQEKLLSAPSRSQLHAALKCNLRRALERDPSRIVLNNDQEDTVTPAIADRSEVSPSVFFF